VNKLPCDRCQHSWSPREIPLDGSHCYMFKEAPKGSFCGQFKSSFGLVDRYPASTSAKGTNHAKS
jgi:hypothetical protein